MKVPTLWVEECTYIIPKVMDWVLASLDFAKCYIGDIIVFNSTIEEHNHHLQNVFDCLGVYDLKLHLGKCGFFQLQVGYLGHMIYPRGLGFIQKAKVDVISKVPKPTNVSRLKASLGLANCYH